MGCPIRRSRDQRSLASPPGFSQRATSFIASQCQGIHQMPFFRARSKSGPRPGVAAGHDTRIPENRRAQGQTPEPDRSARLRRIAPLLATPTRPSHEDTSPDRPRHRPRPHRPRPAPEAVRLGHIRKSALPFNQPRPRCRRRPTGRPTPSRGHGPPGTASSRPGTKLHLLRTSSSERRDQRSKGRDQITTGEPAPPAIEAPGGGRAGGGERDRTDDLLLAKQALSQLSYTPVQGSVIRISRQNCGCAAAALAASTGADAIGSDNRLLIPDNWWAREDLNLRPHAYQARALTS